jgi:hypothetical protein
LALLVSLAACGGGGADEAPKTASGGSSAEGDTAGTDPGFAEYAASHGIATLNGGGSSEAPEVTADGLRLELLDKDRPVKLDGVLTEWPPFAKATVSVKGSSKSQMKIGLQYDDAKLYVGADIADAAFQAGQDHVSLVLAVPQPGGGYATRELEFFAGKPGETEGSVRAGRGDQVPGAKIVEAPTNAGYSLEATVPWAGFPEARVTRVGIHGVARYVEGDGVIATGPSDLQHPASMAWVPSEPELSMIEQLLAPKSLTKTAPIAEVVADLTGDGIRERVAVFDHYLTICGSSFMGGTGFFFRDLGGDLVKLEARDAAGRGHGEVVLQRRATVGDATREVLEVLTSTGTATEPRVAFAHEISVRQGQSHVDNAIRVAHGEIDVATEPASSWDPASYKEPIADDVDPILLPWGAVKSQVWKWDGVRFAKVHEVTQKETFATAPAGERAARPIDHSAEHPPEPPTPKVARGGNMSGALLDLYRHDRGVDASVAPKVDLKVHVAGDEQPERVLLIGRDIVVFGPGFKEGSQYAYVTLAQFADARDITDLSARDLTGDGAADLVVRGSRRVTSGKSSVEMEMIFVYQVTEDAITRIFAIETGREQGKKRVQGLVQFIPASDNHTFDILAAPGRATGWTAKTYPWSQETPGSGDVEPLLLPWGGVSSVRYRWSGTAFAVIP